MRKTFIISLVLLLAIKGYAQNDHLEPIRNINSYDQYTKQYIEHDFALLYSGMNARPLPFNHRQKWEFTNRSEMVTFSQFFDG